MKSPTRKALIKLASCFEQGSPERRTILSNLIEQPKVTRQAVLRALGDIRFGSVTVNNRGKLAPVKPQVAGFPGGSIVKGVASNAYLEKNREIGDYIISILKRVGATIDRTGHKDGFTATFNQGKDAFSYSFEWMPYPTRVGDRYSKTFWLVLSVG